MKQIQKTAMPLCVIFVLMVLFSSVSKAEDLSSGIITGKVTNMTVNEKDIQGLEITLHQYANENTSEVGRTKTDKTGSFQFEGLSAEKARIYYASTLYKGIQYMSQGMHFHKEHILFIDLVVHDTTDKDKDIHVKMHHIFLEEQNDSLIFTEVMVVENRGKTVYIGSQEGPSNKRKTLQVSVPKGATDLQYGEPLMACCLIETENGFADTMDIKPGAKTISFSYTVKPKGPQYAFLKGIHLDTDHLDVIFPAKGFRGQSEQLELTGAKGDMEQGSYHLMGKDIKKGTRIAVHFSELPLERNPVPWIVGGVVIGLMSIGFAVLLMKRRKSKGDKSRENRNTDERNLKEERQRALQAIADLDDLSESGGIEGQEYDRKRAEFFQKAQELSEQLNKENERETSV